MTPTAYLDTTIISGLAKLDYDDIENAAMLELRRLHEEGQINLCSSPRRRARSPGIVIGSPFRLAQLR